MLHVVNTIKRILRTAWVNSRYALFHRNTSKIFCIGFNKTGTTSLYHALLREGLKVGDQPTAERLLASYVDGNFDPIVEYCKTARAFQDVPFSMPNTYRHLCHAFPDAKFILSVRDSGDQWYESQLRFAAKRLGRTPTLKDLKEAEYCWKGWSYQYHQAVFGNGVEFEDKQAKIHTYEQHIADVQNFFRDKPGQLLVLNVGEEGSFSKFCQYLGIRSKHTAFPWAKRTASLRAAEAVQGSTGASTGASTVDSSGASSVDRLGTYYGVGSVASTVDSSKVPPRVSVVVLTCNHELYIHETLEGIVTQQTNFPFEVIVHDDASSDRTPDIIKEYQKKYPHLIKPIFQTENQWFKGVNPISTYIFPHVSGEYIAFCEGDDYWTDPSKLQKQVDFMDHHPDYTFCSHDVHMKYEDGVNVKEVFYTKPAVGSFSFTFLDEFMNHFLATATLLVRRKVAMDMPVTNNMISVEIYSMLYFLSRGNGYYMEDKMVVKRRNPGGITMNLAYRENISFGQYRLWNEVLAFAPIPYKKLIRCKIAEYQRQFIKKRSFPSGTHFFGLLMGSILNNPYWFVGLSERYRQSLLSQLVG